MHESILTTSHPLKYSKINISFNTIDRIIYTNECIIGFYKGVKIYTLKTIPSTAIQFTIYDKLKII